MIEDTCWKFRGGEVRGEDERLRFKVKGERWDLPPGQGSKVGDGRGKVVTF